MYGGVGYDDDDGGGVCGCVGGVVGGYDWVGVDVVVGLVVVG